MDIVDAVKSVHGGQHDVSPVLSTFLVGRRIDDVSYCLICFASGPTSSLMR